MVSREEVLSTLKAHEAELRARGVAHVAVFGSLARAEARPDSEVDLWKYSGTILFLRDMFPTEVDVADRQTLRERVRPSAERDELYAF